MAEDGFHEIQLNGKQLVFLFMATAVVAAVIFLSGVMVGRGVRTQKESLLEAGTPVQPAESTVAPGGAQAQPGGAIPAAPPSAQGQAARDELSYYGRLEATGSPKETLKPASSGTGTAAASPQAKPVPPPSPAGVRPAAPSDSARQKPPPQESGVPAARAATAAKAPVEPPKTAPKAPAESPSPDAPRPAEAAGGTFSVQVGAMRSREGAEAFVKELSAKGYDGYVVAPPAGSSLFRVRVGKYKDRRDAEEIKRRLEKENYKPLITR